MTRDNILDTYVFLPSDENNYPDWLFMENYIKSLHCKEITTQRTLHRCKLDNVNKWCFFKISRLFDVVLSKGDIKLDDMDVGNISLVSSGENNNGIIGKIDDYGDGKAEIFNGNLLTIDMFCNAYYQPHDFYAVSHGRVNILKPKFKLNKYIGLFIVTIIKKEKYKFSYGRAIYSNVAMNMTVKLPCKKAGDSLLIDYKYKFSDEGYIPDWEFMENYIKSLPYSDRI
jgi:hypothetical protein